MAIVTCPLCETEFDLQPTDYSDEGYCSRSNPPRDGECSVCRAEFCTECADLGAKLICEQCHALVCSEHAVEIEGETHCPKCAKIAWEREAA